MTREEGLALARLLQTELQKRKLPVHQVYLFGSVAKGKTHQWSDIDIAVICDPFRKTRHEEDMELRLARRGIDSRISPISIHLEDLENHLSTLVHEVKQHGIPV